MKIELTPKQEAYLRGLVKSGAYDSVEDAVDDILTPSEDDAWMKPFVDDALADIDSGRTAPWDVGELRRELTSRHPELLNGKDR